MKLSIILLVIVLIAGSCSRKEYFQDSAIVPAAEGYVKIKKDKNSNYAISLNVTNLAGPTKLQAARKNYVVWSETENIRAENIGKLRSVRGLFSRTYKGKLETVTSTKPVRIFITAEDADSPRVPSDEVILNTKLFGVK
jgi:hypothetical protein